MFHQSVPIALNSFCIAQQISLIVFKILTKLT